MGSVSKASDRRRKSAGPRIVLILGSAPDATLARSFDATRISDIVAINNAWRIRPDWTHHIHPEDFPPDRMPAFGSGQCEVTHRDYVPANNAHGGVVYAGGTMAFNAGYWALECLNPDILAFCGCDMVYDKANGATHFYGNGRPDPVRPDPTLQSLEAKANRLMLLAARQGCLCVNLSRRRESRLTFPRLPVAALPHPMSAVHEAGMTLIGSRQDTEAIDRALACERSLSCVVPSGDYWNHGHLIDAGGLGDIDRLWLAAWNGPVAQYALASAGRSSVL